MHLAHQFNKGKPCALAIGGGQDTRNVFKEVKGRDRIKVLVCKRNGLQSQVGLLKGHARRGIGGCDVDAKQISLLVRVAWTGTTSQVQMTGGVHVQVLEVGVAEWD